MGKAKPLRGGGVAQFSSITQNSVLNHPSFDVVENFHIKEYGLSGSILTHRKSGAQVSDFPQLSFYICSYSIPCLGDVSNRSG